MRGIFGSHTNIRRIWDRHIALGGVFQRAWSTFTGSGRDGTHGSQLVLYLALLFMVNHASKAMPDFSRKTARDGYS